VTNFYTDTIVKDARFKSTKRVADPNLLEPITRGLVDAIIADAAANGMSLMIFETYRSQARQTALFNQGATKLKQVGVHHFGLACDIVKDVGGQPSWKGDFSLLGDLARHHGMIWGGDWGTPGSKHSFVDTDHVQRCTIGRQASLFAGKWYPDKNYDPYKDMK
jgi:D-alanyl-D-alanine carboxypeptidase